MSKPYSAQLFVNLSNFLFSNGCSYFDQCKNEKSKNLKKATNFDPNKIISFPYNIVLTKKNVKFLSAEF